MAFSAYRDSLRAHASQWPELSWLDRFLHAPKPANGDGTSARVFELIGNRFIKSEVDGTAASFSKAIEAEAHNSRMRIVLVSHGQSWDVDRDFVDIVCSKYRLDPRFVANHFDYPGIRDEKNHPRDLRLRIDKVPDMKTFSRANTTAGTKIITLGTLAAISCFHCQRTRIHASPSLTRRNVCL